MQAAQRIPPVAILFDASLEDIGQVLALATVLACDSRREARLAGLSLSRNSLQIAAFSELLVRFYRGDEPGTAVGRDTVPMGMFDEEDAVESSGPMIETVLNRRGSNGGPLYPRRIEKLNDTADPVAVLRNALSAQQDQNAVVVLAGRPVNLQGLMALPDGSALVGSKVRALVVASAVDDSGFNQLVGEWPSPIIRASNDLGLSYPAAAIEEDFAWAPDHPLVDAYRAGGTMPYDTPAHAMAAVLYAVHPDEGYFSLSEPSVGDSPGFQRLMADAEQRDRTIRVLRELVSTQPPEPRRGRGRP